MIFCNRWFVCVFFVRRFSFIWLEKFWFATIFCAVSQMVPPWASLFWAVRSNWPRLLFASLIDTLGWGRVPCVCRSYASTWIEAPPPLPFATVADPSDPIRCFSAINSWVPFPGTRSVDDWSLNSEAPLSITASSRGLRASANPPLPHPRHNEFVHALLANHNLVAKIQPRSVSYLT